MPPAVPSAAPSVALGTAHLFALVDPGTSGRLLAAAWEAGVRRYDTAPSYGHGMSEPALGTFLAGRDGVEVVTTKVGLDASPRPTTSRRLVKAAARTLLPAPVADRLRGARGGGASGPPGTPGRFRPDAVRAGVERSLDRLGGRVDRLVLHEVHPQEVDDALREELARLVAGGSVGAVGVATQNHLTADAVDRLGPLATVVHVAAGPFHPPVDLPDHVTTRVGHGLLGPGGEHLARLRRTLAQDAGLRERWRDATEGTALAGDRGLGDALLARARRLDVTDVVVATSRPEQVARSYACAGGGVELPDGAEAALEALVEATAAPAP